MNVLVASGAVLVVILGAVLIAGWLVDWTGGYEPDCDSYSFDPNEWRDSWSIEDDSREHQAEALAECGVLEGRSRDEVAAMLGRRTGRASTHARKWRYAAGWVNDGIGVGDGQILNVHFNKSGEVERAALAYRQ